MTQKRLLYIFPTNFEHEGLVLKLEGQMAAFQQKYEAEALPFYYLRSSSGLKKALAMVKYQWTAIGKTLAFDVIYVRYNPKMIWLNKWLMGLSFFKPVFLEHNVNLNIELAYIKRPIERIIHLLTAFCFQFTCLNHVAGTLEMCQYVECFGVKKKRVIYMQNGYLASPIRNDRVDQSSVEKVRKVKESGKKLAVFSGAGSGWHGVNKWIDLLQPFSDVVLVIAGPYLTSDKNQVLTLGVVTSDTLKTIYSYCDFGLASFSTDDLQVTQASPLKTREYLCYGLPIVVNCWDCAADFEPLKPFIFNLKDPKTKIEDVIKTSVDHAQIQALARQYLSWESVMEALFLDLGVTEDQIPA